MFEVVYVVKVLLPLFDVDVYFGSVDHVDDVVYVGIVVDVVDVAP